MRVLTHEFYGWTRTDRMEIVPIGDIHIGNRVCREDRLRGTVKFIAEDPSRRWIGTGDYCEFIQRKDPRFDPETLAEWITVRDLGDLPRAQLNHFLGIIKPIAGQCLGLLAGNHEAAIYRHYERDIYSDIVVGVKRLGGFDPDHDLGLGYNGWLRLKYYRSKKGERKAGVRKIDISLHHGFVGGKLAGAKALNMQRWLWSHECDLAIFGHSHNTATQIEAVEKLDKGDNLEYSPRIGCYAGTYVPTAGEGFTTYSERDGYFPLPIGGVLIRLIPRSAIPERRIIVETYA